MVAIAFLHTQYALLHCYHSYRSRLGSPLHFAGLYKCDLSVQNRSWINKKATEKKNQKKNDLLLSGINGTYE